MIEEQREESELGNTRKCLDVVLLSAAGECMQLV